MASALKIMFVGETLPAPGFGRELCKSIKTSGRRLVAHDEGSILPIGSPLKGLTVFPSLR